MEMQIITINVGDKDLSGEIVTAVYGYNPKYVIYETHSGMKWKTNNQELVKKFTTLSPNISALDVLTAQNPLLQRIARKEIVRAFSLCAYGSIKRAKEHITITVVRIQRLRGINGRLHYLFSCMVVVLLNVILSVIIAAIPSIGQESKMLFYVTTCGSLGGFLSVILNLSKLEIEPDSPWTLNAISGASRIVIGMIGAVFTYFLMKADIFLGIISSSNSAHAMLAVSIVAGFSETLVPHILRRVEAQ